MKTDDSSLNPAAQHPASLATLAPDAPLAVATVAAIRAGDHAALAGLLAEHPDLARTWIEGRSRSGTRELRSLLHIATDWPARLPHVAATIAELVRHGADVDARFVGPRPETPLHWAASADDVDALDALLDAGADIEAPGAVIGGGAPLADARGFKQWRAAFRLVERGAQVTLDDAATLGLLDRLRAHCEADPAPEAEALASGLWNACHGGRRNYAEYLVARGAALNWVAPWAPQTPLDAAIAEGAEELAAWLRARGARTAADLV